MIFITTNKNRTRNDLIKEVRKNYGLVKILDCKELMKTIYYWGYGHGIGSTRKPISPETFIPYAKQDKLTFKEFLNEVKKYLECSKENIEELNKLWLKEKVEK